MNLRVHTILHGSKANGPGIRSVIWLQGCTLNCPGCFNPQTHAAEGGELISTDTLTRRLKAMPPETEGITISGGEPFEQAEALAEFLTRFRRQENGSVIVFSGFTKEKIETTPQYRACISLIDVLICGPYNQNAQTDHLHYLASANQELWFVSDRYNQADLTGLPTHEVFILSDGSVTVSGLGAIQ